MTPEEANAIRRFLESRSGHLAHGRDGVRRFEYWANDRMSVDSGFHIKLAEGARSVLCEGNAPLACAALQSLAVAGSLGDCELIAHYALNPSPAVAKDAQICLKHLKSRFKTLAQLLTEVSDRESFIAFAYALLDDRERNEPLLEGDIGGLSDRPREQWHSNSISDYLAAALSYFVCGDQRPEQLTWQDIAAFFDSGRTSDRPVASRLSVGTSLVGEVTSHDSFVTFVGALIEDRRRAEALERENPEYWAIGTPEGWQNSRISDFIGHAMLNFDNGGNAVPEPSWVDLADSLFQGKIRE
jgi:hypothetical protein